MRPEVRHAALLAALKTTQHTAPAERALRASSLVLGLTGAYLGGCALSHAAPLASVDAPPTADVATPEPDAPVDCDTLLASLEVSAAPGGWGGQFTSEAARVDPAVGACCLQWDLDLQEGRRDPEGWPPSPLAFACCDVEVFVQNLAPVSGLGCTPWGPPCPPEMPLLS